AARRILRGCTDTTTTSRAGVLTLVTGIETAPLGSRLAPVTAVVSAAPVPARGVAGVVDAIVAAPVGVAAVVELVPAAVVVGSSGRVGRVTGSDGTVPVGVGKPSAAA